MKFFERKQWKKAFLVFEKRFCIFSSCQQTSYGGQLLGQRNAFFRLCPPGAWRRRLVASRLRLNRPGTPPRPFSAPEESPTIGRMKFFERKRGKKAFFTPRKKVFYFFLLPTNYIRRSITSVNECIAITSVNESTVGCVVAPPEQARYASTSVLCGGEVVSLSACRRELFLFGKTKKFRGVNEPARSPVGGVRKSIWAYQEEDAFCRTRRPRCSAPHGCRRSVRHRHRQPELLLLVRQDFFHRFCLHLRSFIKKYQII